MRRRWIVTGIAGIVVLGLAAGGVVWLTRGGASTPPPVDPGSPQPTVGAYLAAWGHDDWAGMRRLVADPPADFAARHEQVVSDLHVAEARYAPGAARIASGPGPTTTSTGATATTGPPVLGRATVPFTATLTLTGLGDWTYRGRLHLVRRAGRPWRVVWTPATIHPALTGDRELTRTRVVAERAPILGAGGQPLVAERMLIEVGLEPRRIHDRAEVQQALAQHLGVDPATVAAKLDAPGVRPDYFVPIVSVTPEQWAQVKDQVLPVPGVIFREQRGRVAVHGDVGAEVLGRTGEITKERLDQLGSPYEVGDVVGLSGLEAAFERQLAGAPSGEVRVVDGKGDTVQVLRRFAGKQPVALHTTLDPSVQAAAEQALADVTKPAGLVALDATTGAVRAIVSRPTDGFPRAIDGRYPPGSTMKVVTATALLTHGVTPDTPVTCPATVTVGGKVFANYQGEQLGTIPFRRAFTASCNTAFIGAETKLPADALGAAAKGFGFGTDYSKGIGFTTFRGSFPTPVDATERAADAIGQGRVEASPLHMASVAGAVASGTWRPPYLLPDRRSDVAPHALDPNVAATLRDLMFGVVQSGTGTAAAIPGQQIGGKTGTAEFGSGNPPATHAWFIGFRGDLAFAVVVEGGGVGGEVAAPVAHRLLAALPPG